MNKLIY